MNRILLACISLALPSFVAAASCGVLPYANQCQGSNLWPSPAGWVADNNGDCQPEPSVVWGWAVVSPSNPFCADYFGLTKEAAGASCAASMLQDGWSGRIFSGEYGPGCGWGEGQFAAWHDAHSIMTCSNYSYGHGDGSARAGGIWTSWHNVKLCPRGDGGWTHTNTTLSTCPVVAKPSDGVCTARWTTADETTLQKDPLDPDCDAQSCVFDGTCKLL